VLLELYLLYWGIAGVAVSSYIDQEVLEGKYKISSAQKKVDQEKKLTNIAPKEVQPIGGALTDSAQQKNRSGKS